MNDSKVGGEVLIVPKISGNAAASIGATTNLLLLCFPSSLELVPVLCAILFNSELSINNEIPVSWKLGIDTTVSNEEAYDNAKVAQSGPTCLFHGMEISWQTC